VFGTGDAGGGAGAADGAGVVVSAGGCGAGRADDEADPAGVCAAPIVTMLSRIAIDSGVVVVIFISITFR